MAVGAGHDGHELGAARLVTTRVVVRRSPIAHYACGMKDELVVRSANPGLERYIDRYWGYEHWAAGPGRQREPPWERRFELVEATLACKLANAQAPPPDVDWAWRRLVAARGALRIKDLAVELGCSRKHLAARFREHVGLPPKLVARFRHASDLMDKFAGASFAEIAALCGYYDQAHLDRDFRDFAGTTPTGYLAERVTFVQDSGVDAS